LNPNPFKNILKKKCVIVGVGNPLKGDDGIGPALVERLQGRIEGTCINSESAPENYTGKIKRENPDTILIVDAVHLGRSPGEYEILEKDDLLTGGLTTHALSPAMFIEYLENETKANIYLLGIQPESLKFGEPLSEKLEKTLALLTELITIARPKKPLIVKSAEGV